MILIIDNYDSFTYNLYQAVSVFEEDIRVARNDRITLSEIKSMKPSHVILSPGPGRPEHAGICMELIQAIAAQHLKNISILGVCLGHQAIVTALGGNVIQSSEIVHGKSDEVFHSKKYLYRHCSNPLKAGRYHSLIAERETLPDTLIIESENKDGIIMGVRHRKLPIFGVQFHPESILTEEGMTILNAFVRGNHAETCH